MKIKEYKTFKERLIADNFDSNSYYMIAGYLWLSLTNRQVEDLKATARRLRVGKEVSTGLQLGNWILKD